ncbi:MAG: tRNA dihydrouridine(20/20a) synthase DusA [Burkholderiaceae bacterium]
MRKLCVAPMMDWTDRHCRFFHRLLAPNALLYTEMITTGAILHGDLSRLLTYNPAEHPVALQLGGSEPNDLARAAKIGAEWGYDEINLNCGCPSERVQKGAFGACLMREPGLVAECVQAMREAVAIPVTVKHRIGVDHEDSYDFVSRFVHTLMVAGCEVFLVHARSAMLKGLSPKENREIPPLRYAIVRRLKQDFPQALFVINGGITTLNQALLLMQPCAPDPGSADYLPGLDGVMIGRAAYHDPWLLHDLDQALFGHDPRRPAAREAIINPLSAYYDAGLASGVPARAMARHWHGLYYGQPGARHWRRAMSEGVRPFKMG